MSIASAAWSLTSGNLEGLIGTNLTQPAQTGIWTLPAVTETSGGLQTSSWMELNGRPGFVFEVTENAFLGSWSLEASNDKTNIYVLERDNCPTTAQTVNKTYYHHGSYRYIRVKCTPIASNTSVAFQARIFGQDAVRNMQPWNGPLLIPNLQVANSANRVSAVSSTDFQVPLGAVGIDVLFNITTFTGGTNCTLTLQYKDPENGTYITALAGAAQTTTGAIRMQINPNLTASANTIAKDYVWPDMAWTMAKTGTFTNLTYSIGVVPVFG